MSDLPGLSAVTFFPTYLSQISSTVSHFSQFLDYVLSGKKINWLNWLDYVHFGKELKTLPSSIPHFLPFQTSAPPNLLSGAPAMCAHPRAGCTKKHNSQESCDSEAIHDVMAINKYGLSYAEIARMKQIIP